MEVFERLKKGFEKTKQNISNGLDSVFGDYSEVDEDFFEELSEVLIMSDVGVRTSESITDDLKEKIHEQRIKEPDKAREFLKGIIAGKMALTKQAYDFEDERSVVLVVGVNGAGKTTFIGKMADLMRRNGKKVLLCAADTFRAAAIEQLSAWAQRSQTDIVYKEEGSDPAAVVYEACDAFKSRKADLMLCDTAGRLQNKKNLMDELSKINRILEKELPGVRKEVLLVLDATTGQNALSQAREFTSVCHTDGIVLTKMDGSAKGGVVIAIYDELKIPVKYVCTGEKIEDMDRFDPESFVSAIFD